MFSDVAADAVTSEADGPFVTEFLEHDGLLLEGTLLRIVPVDAKREEGLGLRLGRVSEAEQGQPGAKPGPKELSVHGIHAHIGNGPMLKQFNATRGKYALRVAVLN